MERDRIPKDIGDYFEKNLRNLLRTRYAYARFREKQQFIQDSSEELKAVLQEALGPELDELDKRVQQYKQYR